MKKIWEKMAEAFAGSEGSNAVHIDTGDERIDKLKKPINEEFRLAFQNQVGKIDRDYQREKERQEHVGETLSRIAPISSLTYVAINLTQTGKLKRDGYFQTGERYYSQVDDTYFSEVSDDAMGQIMQIAARLNDSSESETDKILPPPTLTEPSLSDTLRRSAVDVFLLGFFAIAFTAIAFLKFFRSDI